MPRKCTASFAAGARVVLSPHSGSGLRLVRWAGGCTGSGACKVKVSAPTAVTAVFGAASKAATKPRSRTSAEPGYYSDGYVRFFVSPTGKTVQNFTSYVVNIMCTSPVTGAPGQVQGFAIPVAAIKPDGSVGGRHHAERRVRRVAGDDHLLRLRAHGGRHRDRRRVGEWHLPRGHRTEGQLEPHVHVEQPTVDGPEGRPVSAGEVDAGLREVLRRVLHVLRLGLQSARPHANYVVTITCLPAVTGAPGQVQGFAIPEATINPDGSFTGKATQSGVFAGSPATITYSAAGNFQGLS